MLQENLKIVLDEIKSCGKSDVTLIAVTKNIDIDRINQIIDLGVLDIGENKVQEIIEKYDKLNPAARIHLIGHLQTNKVKYIIDKVFMIHSVDSYKLALEINKRAAEINKQIKVLIQVNTSKEETKFGISEASTKELLKQTQTLKNLDVMGFMTIAPFTQDEELINLSFLRLANLFKEFKAEYNLKYLSMGMSNDFKLAINQGSNMVRLGTAVFGNRIY